MVMRVPGRDYGPADASVETVPRTVVRESEAAARRMCPRKQLEIPRYVACTISFDGS